MTREVLTAAVVSGLASGLSISYRSYEFWRSWAKKAFRFGFTCHLIANAATGVLAVALAHLAKWDPFPEKWLLNGVVFATTGQALLRIEPRGFGLDRLNAPRSLLARAV